MNRSKPRRIDGELLWTFFLSLAAHALLVFLFLAGPNRYLQAAAPPLESYTVELVAPGVVGGDDGPLGPAGETVPEAAPSADGAADAEEIEEVVEEPEPEIEEVVEEPEPEIEESVEEAEPEVAESADEPVEVARPQPADTVAATAVPTKKAAAKPKPAARPPTPDPVAERDRRIAEAIRRRAQQSSPGSVDERIAAAVRRKADGIGGGSGGPLSAGPGSGPGGGTVIGAEYVLYKRRMEVRIRDAWVWAGVDDSLEAVVRFGIAPDGRVENVRTTRPSGDKAYDASVERAVEAASPLGVVPENYRREFADIEMTFRAKDLRR